MDHSGIDVHKGALEGLPRARRGSQSLDSTISAATPHVSRNRYGSLRFL